MWFSGGEGHREETGTVEMGVGTVETGPGTVEMGAGTVETGPGTVESQTLNLWAPAGHGEAWQ